MLVSLLGGQRGLAQLEPEIDAQLMTVSGDFEAQWPTVTGNTYFLETSTDMINWTYLPYVNLGTGGLLTQPFSSVSHDRKFLKVKSTDVPTTTANLGDPDFDGLSNYWELTHTNSDPLSLDTDNDGMNDWGEWFIGTSSNDDGTIDINNGPLGDKNGNGINNWTEYIASFDTDNDGIPNALDNDVDGDGVDNGYDPDIDGDGLINELDPDADGDGETNTPDSDADGDGTIDEEDETPLGPISSTHHTIILTYTANGGDAEACLHQIGDGTFWESDGGSGGSFSISIPKERNFYAQIATGQNSSGSVTVDLQGGPWFTANDSTETLTNTVSAAENSVEELNLHSIKIRWNIPLESWSDVTGHDETPNGNPSVIITTAAPWNTPQKIGELGLKLKCTSDRHLPGGTPENTNLIDHTQTVFTTVGGELLVSFNHTTMNNFGLIPANEADNSTEYAYCDTATPGAAGSNFKDSENFAKGISNGAPMENGKARGGGDIAKLEAVANKQFMKHAGVDYLKFSFGAAETEKRQVRNQVEWFYYSGHGSHGSGELLLVNDESFAASEAIWNKELHAVIFAGCSVLDIKNFRAQSFGLGTWLQWQAAGGASSPGAAWESTGPDYLLGYAWAAPLDTQGADVIATDFTSGLNAGKHIITAWKDANDRATGRNACLIDTSVNPHEYYYWDEQGANPIWTKKTKGANGW